MTGLRVFLSEYCGTIGSLASACQLYLTVLKVITRSPIDWGKGYCFRSISLFCCFFLCFFVRKITRKRQDRFA